MEAVDQITIMLTEKNWKEISKYYDLTNTMIICDSLISGQYFYTEKMPEVAHPAGFWKYKHPFSPPFRFIDSKKVEGKKNIIEVTVGIEIDQGAGMTQKGFQSFLMRKSSDGYQIIPKNN